ncbi:GNAT family N-acetyltransferase [Kitasatospora sp. NPDC054939]
MSHVMRHPRRRAALLRSTATTAPAPGPTGGAGGGATIVGATAAAVRTAGPTDGRPPELLPLADGLSLHRRTVVHAPALNAAVRADLRHLRPWMEWAAEAPSLAYSTASARAGVAAWDAGTHFMYVAVPDGQPDRVIGGFGLHGRIGPGALELGYWVGSAHTGRGIATAAAGALTAAALALPGIVRVEIHCDAANYASAAVPRKLGYRLDRVAEAPVKAPGETGRQLVWIREH